MKKNMGNIDRLIRVALAIIFAVIYFAVPVKGVGGIILLVLAVVFLLTSAISFCPLYPLVGINTCPKDKV